MKKKRENISKLDPNQDTHANWKKADPINVAWLLYGPSEVREQFRESGSNPGLSNTLRVGMELDLRHRIGAGEVLAFGIQTEPQIGDFATRIPETLFQSPDAKIDWNYGVITGLGRKFEDVRICLGQKLDERPTSADQPSTVRPKGKGGRPSQYSKAKIILESLFRNPDYREMPSSQLLDIFRAEFQKRYGDHRVAPISERSLRVHMSKYRQELAETGKNDFAD